MRLRLPDLLGERGLSAYKLAKLSNGQISLSTAYRLVRLKGRVKTFDNRLCELLCDILKVGPKELFEREPRRRWPHPKG